jgi:hypothetical protein
MKTKNKSYCLILSILLCFFLQTSFGQEKYLPGYIVLPQGDTLHGFVDYRNWERTPNKIFFKKKISDDKSVHSPLDIREFGVLDEIYESAIIETEVSPVNTSELQYNPELIIKRDTCFLQAMVKGVKSLYYYKNILGQEQFYIKQYSSFELLIHKKYLKDHNGRSVIVENKKYVGQLTIYLNDCSAIQQKLNNTDYQKNSLENLFLAYYNCTKSEINFHKKTEKLSNAFGVIAGASWTSLAFHNNPYFSYLINAEYNNPINFTAGLFFEVILSRNNGKWSIGNELIITSYKVDGQYNVYTNENQYTYIHTTLGYTYLKMNNMLRFKYPVGKLFIYLNAGISNGYAIIEKNYLKQESKFYSQESVEEGKALYDTRRYEVGLNVGLGTKFKRYSFEIRYESSNGMSTYLSLKSSVNKLYLLLGFKF